MDVDLMLALLYLSFDPSPLTNSMYPIWCTLCIEYFKISSIYLPRQNLSSAGGPGMAEYPTGVTPSVSSSCRVTGAKSPV